MYKFDKINHIHELYGKPLMGVTTILSVISKPALIQWSANMACDYIGGYIEKLIEESTEDEYEPMLSITSDEGIEEIRKKIKEAKTAHRIKKEKAGDWGTVVHKKVELWITEDKEYKVDEVIDLCSNELKSYIRLTEDEKKYVDIAFNNFKKWSVENKVKFIESEKNLYSKEMWVGGIVDLVFEMDGKKYIGDIKTSSGIYDEAFFQMGAYHLMLEEMGEGEGIEGYIVINLKKDGKIDMKMADNLKINQEAFKHALGLYKIKQTLK